MDVTWDLLDRERRAGKRILFEGAQGALLDIDHGTYPFVTSSNTVAAQAATGSGMGPRRASATCSASPRPTPRASAPARSRPSSPTRSASCIGERGHEFGTVTGPQAPLRLVRRRAGAPDRQGRRHRRHRADQARRARRLRARSRSASATCSTASASTACRPATTRRRACKPIYETLRGLDAVDARRAQLGRPAGAGGQVRAPHRGADRVPGDAALDQPRARRHHPDARPVRGLR